MGYNIEALKVELLVSGKKLRIDMPIENGHGVMYEELFDFLSEIFHEVTNELDERIYDEIDTIDDYSSYGDDYND